MELYELVENEILHQFAFVEQQYNPPSVREIKGIEIIVDDLTPIKYSDSRGGWFLVLMRDIRSEEWTTFNFNIAHVDNREMIEHLEKHAKLLVEEQDKLESGEGNGD